LGIDGVCCTADGKHWAYKYRPDWIAHGQVNIRSGTLAFLVWGLNLFICQVGKSMRMRKFSGKFPINAAFFSIFFFYCQHSALVFVFREILVIVL